MNISKTRIGLAVAFFSLAVFAVVRADDVPLSLTVDADVNRIEFSSLVFVPEQTATETVRTWEPVETAFTNNFYGMKPTEVITVMVLKQSSATQTVTVPAHWEVSFAYTIPASQSFSVGAGLSATARKMISLDVTLSLTPSELEAVTGKELYASAVASAGVFGSVPVTGALSDALKTKVMTGLIGQ